MVPGPNAFATKQGCRAKAVARGQRQATWDSGSNHRDYKPARGQAGVDARRTKNSKVMWCWLLFELLKPLCLTSWNHPLILLFWDRLNSQSRNGSVVLVIVSLRPITASFLLESAVRLYTWDYSRIEVFGGVCHLYSLASSLAYVSQTRLDSGECTSHSLAFCTYTYKVSRQAVRNISWVNCGIHRSIWIQKSPACRLNHKLFAHS